MIDSHAHLDMVEFEADREEVIKRAMDHGLTAIISIGIDEASSRAALGLARKYPVVFAVAGIHPNDTSAAGDGLDWLSELAGDERVVAIGEIGLDFYRKKAARECQFEYLRRQLEIAAEKDIPVVIHCREAHREFLPVLEEWVRRHNRRGELGVLHCFSGDTNLANRYIELGFLVSLAGPVTYKNAYDAAEVARSVPLDKLLVETDCPFLAPQRYRGKRNEPSYVSLVIERIAGLRGVSTKTVARATAQNAVRLFRLPGN